MSSSEDPEQHGALLCRHRRRATTCGNSKCSAEVPPAPLCNSLPCNTQQKQMLLRGEGWCSWQSTCRLCNTPLSFRQEPEPLFGHWRRFAPRPSQDWPPAKDTALLETGALVEQAVQTGHLSRRSQIFGSWRGMQTSIRPLAPPRATSCQVMASGTASRLHSSVYLPGPEQQAECVDLHK